MKTKTSYLTNQEENILKLRALITPVAAGTTGKVADLQEIETTGTVTKEAGDSEDNTADVDSEEATTTAAIDSTLVLTILKDFKTNSKPRKEVRLTMEIYLVDYYLNI